MRNKEYDEKLYDEILVDCRDEYEQNMSWFYYAQDEMEFPFEAQIELRKRKGGKQSRRIKVINLSNNDTNFERNFDLKVDIELDDYIIEIPLAELFDVEANENTDEIIKIWKYWIKK